ncbi:MAG: tyrosine-type recombinase/integrase [Clostridia bacterium]|nr:tyrosine-type recombinase/integrase [Clostridia bacterium]
MVSSKTAFARKRQGGKNQPWHSPDDTPLYHYAQGYMLILNTGLRMGEALSLQWTDVDFAKKTISVNKNRIITRKRDEEGNALSG